MLSKKILSIIPVTFLAFVLFFLSLQKKPITVEAQKSNSIVIDHDKKKLTPSNKKTIFHDLLKKHLSLKTPKNTILNFLDTWMKKKPKEVIRFILKMKSTSFQFGILTLAIEIWHNNSPEDLKRWFIDKKPNNVLTKYCKSTTIIPESCIYYAEKINDIKTKNEIIQFQLQSWVDIDTEKAIAWSITSKRNFESFGTDVYRYIINIDFNAALYYLSTINSIEPTASSKIADVIDKKIYQSGINAESYSNLAAIAIISLLDSPFKDTLILALTPTFFRFGSNHSNMILLESMADNPITESLQHNFVANLALKQGPQVALKYLEQLSNEAKKQQLVTTILMTWGKGNIDEAYEWQKSQGETSIQTNISLMQMALNQNNTTIALELIESIKDNPNNTYETIEYDFQIAKLMYVKNPALAIDHLRKITDLSNEEKDAIVEYFIDQQVTN